MVLPLENKHDLKKQTTGQSIAKGDIKKQGKDDMCS
jgi:hypothetical protein